MNQQPDLILPTRLIDPVDHGDFDLYLPERGGRPPVVLLVHGLFQQPPPVSPRWTPFFRAYASQLAHRGMAAVVFDHELTGGVRYPEAAATLDRVLSAVRGSSDVDGDTVALWFFSGGGPLAYPPLAAGHDWLRCVALTYPLLPTEDIPGWPSLSDAVRALDDTPVVLTLVEHELPAFAAGQRALLEARPVGLTTIDVPAAQHGFDTGPDTAHGRAAVLQALDAVAGHLVAAQVGADRVERPSGVPGLKLR
ncbi:dienelactone hydrolase family protein [Modestobacter altitudinis]|uniref:dienelactone hydrolase family protein n=1 Tax=Modestobacter altitudinis TaxID=2213158 RepID=UPI00110C93E7|nr:alpha/beta hydrolase [Modestobacter altitudinis]